MSPAAGAAARTPDLSIIVVSYNVRDYLAACLKSLPGATAGLAFETFVIDNASADGTADLVQDEFPDAHLIRNATNRTTDHRRLARWRRPAGAAGDVAGRGRPG